MFRLGRPTWGGAIRSSKTRLYWNWLANSLSGSGNGSGKAGVRQPNQVFLSIRNENEMTDTLIASNKTPLIMNFTMRNNAPCDKLTGALNRIVMLETDKKVNAVDVETDWPETKDVMLRFGVNNIPMLVAVRKSFPTDYYVPGNLTHEDVDWYGLKEWIEKNSDF